MKQIKLQQFEGPLDLLLSLIEQQELDITKIALAQVTEQFLDHVKQLERLDAASLADYLTIAAKLLVIKSKAILPTIELDEEETEEETAEDLANRLLLYKQYKEAAKGLKKLDDERMQSFTRTLVFSERISFMPDSEVTADVLRLAAGSILSALRELDNLPKAKVREVISIQEKINQLQNRLSIQVETKLSTLLGEAKNKPEAIITFLALLELIKQRIFSVEQDDMFAEITIRKYQQSPSENFQENQV